VALQVVVGGADDRERRSVDVYSRPDGAPAEQPWVRHASGTLAGSACGTGAADGAADWAVGDWPPAGAERIELDGHYPRLAETGYAYGPAFQGLIAAWRRGDELFATVRLDGEQRDGAGRYALHPALLDAALHAVLLDDDADRVDGVRLPFSWSGVTVAAGGAANARVRIARSEGDAVSIRLADDAGRPVASVESLALRPVTEDRLRAAGRVGDDLYRVVWSPVVVAGGELVGRWAVVGASVDASWG
ncbi:hypothetical protein VM98_32895, partial [Streptomyces rubellomurinus subsp. indigoferus]